MGDPSIIDQKGCMSLSGEACSGMIDDDQYCQKADHGTVQYHTALDDF